MELNNVTELYMHLAIYQHNQLIHRNTAAGEALLDAQAVPRSFISPVNRPIVPGTQALSTPLLNKWSLSIMTNGFYFFFFLLADSENTSMLTCNIYTSPVYPLLIGAGYG